MDKFLIVRDEDTRYFNQKSGEWVASLDAATRYETAGKAEAVLHSANYSSMIGGYVVGAPVSA